MLYGDHTGTLGRLELSTVLSEASLGSYRKISTPTEVSGNTDSTLHQEGVHMKAGCALGLHSKEGVAVFSALAGVRPHKQLGSLKRTGTYDMEQEWKALLF